MADPAAPAGGRRIGFVFYAAVLLALAILIALGSWQVRRLHWKEGLLASIDQRLGAAPVSLDVAVARWEQDVDVDYLPIHLEGRFRHADEQHYLATFNGQSGWYVYTPLVLTDGRVVIVNRGFVPYALKDPATRPWQPVAGLQRLHGLARNPLSEKPGWLVPDNAPEDRIWYWKDHAGMAQEMNLTAETVTPFFVDLAATAGPDGPIGGVTRVALPNRHLEYAVTWFGLAGVLVVTAALLVWRNSRRPDR